MSNNDKMKRVDITLPISTIELIDRIWPKKQFRSRSAFLDRAARDLVLRLERADLKRKLKTGYKARADENKQIVNEWEVVSNELLD